VAFCHPGGEEVVHGEMHGRIIREMRGDGGFGYDVVFVADEHAEEGLTSAELDPQEKDRISHRGRALRELGPVLAAVLDGSRSPS
jgi:XTP/dITP diphosphohydrolase